MKKAVQRIWAIFWMRQWRQLGSPRKAIHRLPGSIAVRLSAVLKVHSLLKIAQFPLDAMA